eukprot:244919_1
MIQCIFLIYFLIFNQHKITLLWRCIDLSSNCICLISICILYKKTFIRLRSELNIKQIISIQNMCLKVNKTIINAIKPRIESELSQVVSNPKINITNTKSNTKSNTNIDSQIQGTHTIININPLASIPETLLSTDLTAESFEKNTSKPIPNKPPLKFINVKTDSININNDETIPDKPPLKFINVKSDSININNNEIIPNKPVKPRLKFVNVRTNSMSIKLMDYESEKSKIEKGNNNNNNNNEPMICMQSGCYCKNFKALKSEWRIGKCSTCDHDQKYHKQLK